ncbi:MAG TPA: MgtC/SapB family protein [Candidatus Eisenbacteria bacterium]|nr:MgtC/SapB family protein [Candidatus Eisenbacteria bacterium]
MRPRTFLAVLAALLFALVIVSLVAGSGPVADALHRLLGIFGATDPAGRPANGHSSITRADVFLRLIVALVLSALIGAEREYHRKPAGLRTNAMVGLSACLMTIAAVLAVDAFPDKNIDPTRVAGQIVTGIGFIGAGAILRPTNGNGHIVGLTTAATLWMVCGLGIAVGLGFYAEAIVTTILVFVTFFALNKVVRKIDEYSKRHPPKHTHGVDDATGHNDGREQ